MAPPAPLAAEAKAAPKAVGAEVDSASSSVPVEGADELRSNSPIQPLLPVLGAGGPAARGTLAGPTEAPDALARDEVDGPPPCNQSRRRCPLGVRGLESTPGDRGTVRAERPAGRLGAKGGMSVSRARRDGEHNPDEDDKEEWPSKG